MKEQARPVNAMNELPHNTREFLARLTAEDVATLEDGVKLVTALRRVGKVTKWLVLTIVGIFLGFVLIWEGVLKVLGWVKS